MLQRIQTVWLILAAACGFALTRVPIYSGRIAANLVENKIATDNIFFFALIIATTLLTVACIFLFKNRTLQFKLTVIAVLLSIGIVAAEIWFIEHYKTSKTLLAGTYLWGGLIPIAMIIFLILAARDIYKDERLIKSLDRLR